VGGAGVGGALGTGGTRTGGAAGAVGGALAGSDGSGATGGSSAGALSGAGGSATGGAGGTAGASGAGGSGPATGCDARKAVADMKLGWNLGNSLDAFDTSKSDTTVETAWGNPIITPQLFGAVADAGFGAVRIPVTWIGRFGAAPDYRISTAFMDRVEQVVNYALDEDLYVIINVHHDGAEGVAGQWISLVDGSGQVSEANTNAVLAQFRKIWEQIAERFADYDEQLIFEGMNEIKVGYDTPLPSYLEQVNGLNQAFVDTARASGGKNTERCLVVPGYNTNIDHTVAGLEKPTDSSPGRLILSDHYYDPWSFAGEASKHAWGEGYSGVDDWGQEEWVRTQVAKLESAFIDQGLPVIWGEYGAVQQTGYEEYRRYYMEYVTKAVHDAGIAPFVWDNGSLASGAEGFGLFDRSDNGVQYPEVLEAIVRATTSNYALADVPKP
jgi:endoglucanase